MATITTLTGTEVQAEIANKLRRNADEIRSLLADIQRTTDHAVEQMSHGYQINMNISSIASRAADLKAESAKQELLVDMAHLVELPTETINYAVTTTERVWFRPATVAEVMGQTDAKAV